MLVSIAETVVEVTNVMRSLRPLGGGIFLAREASMMSSTYVRVRTLQFQRLTGATNLDRSTIDRYTIAFGHSLGRTLGTDEDDVCNTTAGSSRSIRKFYSLDWSYHLDKVLLLIQGLVSDLDIVHVMESRESRRRSSVRKER